MKFLSGQKKYLTIHRVIQYAFLVFFLYVGLNFYFYFLWITGESGTLVARPASVEAFLPISALLAVKRLFLTGQYDYIHPAGLTILLMAFTVSFFSRKGFCGYLCPVGGVSMQLFLLGKRLGINRRPGKWISRLLIVPKYLLLLYMLSYLAELRLPDIEAFLRTPYNIVADGKMLLFFLKPSQTTIIALGTLALGSMIISNFWCRCLCPYGALLGIFSLFSPLAVRRDEKNCIGCGRCSAACPSGINVQIKKRVADPECTGCTECVNACPVNGCLAVRTGYTEESTRLPAWSIAVLTLLIMFGFYIWAEATGRWEHGIPEMMLRRLHEGISGISHP